MLDHPILILMKYLTKKYPRKKQDDHQILPEEVLGDIPLHGDDDEREIQVEGEGHHRRKRRLAPSRPRRTLLHICARIVIGIRIVNHVFEQK